jgi:hypothetical protein
MADTSAKPRKKPLSGRAGPIVTDLLNSLYQNGLYMKAVHRPTIRPANKAFD